MKLKPNHPLSQGLKMSYLLSEGGGNIVYDATGNQNNGVISNVLWGRDGWDIPGSNEHVTIPNFIGQDDDWTIFVSFIQDTRNPDSQANNSTFVSMANGTGSTGRSIFYIHDISAGGTFKLATYVSGGNNTGDTVININEAYTAAFTQSGTSFHFYLNGKDDGSFVATANPADGDIILFDNKVPNGGGCLDGTVGVIHWYDRPLTAEENAWLDRDPYGMFEPDFIPTNYSDVAVIIDVYLTLSQNLDIIKSAQANTQGPVILSNTLATADGGGANALAPVTLSDILSITKSAAMITPQSMNLAESFGVAESGQANSQAPVTISNILSLTLGAEAITESTITISEILALLQTYIAESNRSISLEEILTAVLSSESTAESTLTLSDILALSITEANIFNAAVTLACIQQFADSGMVTASGNTTLNETLTIIQSGLVDAGSETTLSDVLSIISSSEATAGAFVTFAKSLLITQNTAEITQAYLTLAYNLSVQNQAASTAASTLALAINAGISASLVVDAEADLIFPQTLTQTQSASKIAHSNLDINNILSISILAEALAVAGISLDMVEAIDTNTIQVELPDGRTVIIKVEVRTVAISQDDRTVTIS